REEDGPNDIPKEFRGWMGRITAEKSIPKLKEFMEKGGEIVTVGSSTALAFHLDLPLENALMKLDRDGKKAELSGTEYYIPGSLLKATLDVDRAVNWGMPPKWTWSSIEAPFSAWMWMQPPRAWCPWPGSPGKMS